MSRSSYCQTGRGKTLCSVMHTGTEEMTEKAEKRWEKVTASVGVGCASLTRAPPAKACVSPASTHCLCSRLASRPVNERRQAQRRRCSHNFSQASLPPSLAERSTCKDIHLLLDSSEQTRRGRSRSLLGPAVQGHGKMGWRRVSEAVRQCRQHRCGSTCSSGQGKGRRATLGAMPKPLTPLAEGPAPQPRSALQWVHMQ